MAENEKIDEEEPLEESKKKKSFVKVIIIAVIISVLGGGGFFAWTKFSPPPESKDKTETPKKEPEIGPMYPLETFIVNLSEGKGRRYLKVKMQLELSNEKVEQEADKRLPQFRDSLLVLLSSKTFQQVSSVEGKNRLRDEIVSRLNGFLTSGKINEVYFTEFVVQ